MDIFKVKFISDILAYYTQRGTICQVTVYLDEDIGGDLYCVIIFIIFFQFLFVCVEIHLF